MTYAELLAAITAWLENEETTFTGERDRFIRLAERRIHVALELPSAIKNATSNLNGGSPYLQLPDDVISVLDLAIVVGTTHTHLRRRQEGFIREAYPDASTTGTPSDYSVFDDNTVKVGPTPASNINVEMTYHGVPDSVVDVGETWISRNFERALLYGALAEGYAFMKGDPDMIQKYESAFQEEIVKMNNAVLRRSADKDMFESMRSNREGVA